MARSQQNNRVESLGSISEGLKTHLNTLALSVDHYYGVLLSREIPESLAQELVIDWHKIKVQEWLDRVNWERDNPDSRQRDPWNGR